MAHSYPKILNLYKFHKETKGRTTEFSCPEFEYLLNTEWVFTEKVDGTNIRVIFGSDGTYEIRGRTDKAQLHPDLKRAIDKIFLPLAGDFQNMTFYGEGYGPGIQKGGHYAEEKSFVLFDMFVRSPDGELGGYYVPWENMCILAQNRGIPIVPYVFIASLGWAYRRVQEGMLTAYGDKKEFAEGLVGRPRVPIRGIRGERLIVKVKHRDYYGKELVDA